MVDATDDLTAKPVGATALPMGVLRRDPAHCRRIYRAADGCDVGVAVSTDLRDGFFGVP